MNINKSDKQGKAFLLKLVLPGLGQLHRRQWTLGITLASIFLISFAGLLAVFAAVINSYFGILTGDLLKGGHLARIPSSLHLSWVIFLGLVLFADLIVSLVMIWTVNKAD